MPRSEAPEQRGRQTTMRVVMLRKGRRPGGFRQGSERRVDRTTAIQWMAAGRAAVVVPPALPEAAVERPVVGMPPKEASAGHFYVFRRVLLSLESELPGGRRRLRVYEADSELTLTPEENATARALLALGCACRALPRPARKDTLVRLTRPTEVAGAELGPGQVAAVEFDPLSVLPQFRDLGLFPWEEMEIEHGMGEETPARGPALDRVRLIVCLECPWLHPAAGSFLAGVHVDMAYGDYRLHPPEGLVERAYWPSDRDRAPFAVFGR